MEGKEIFLLISDRNTVETPTTSLAFANQDDLNVSLASESFGNLSDEDIEVFHGVLISPKYIPESINGCTPYIMIHNSADLIDAECANEVYFIKGPPEVDRLTKIIEGFINRNLFNTTNQSNKVKMDDIQLFFGHKIPLVFHIDEDYIDEELIERVLKIATKVKELEITHNEEKVNEVNSKS